MNKIFFGLLLISCTAFATESIRYVAIGDSYTIGTGAQLNESWPAVITTRLQNKSIPIELVANLGRNGWTSQNLIDYELPALKGLKPDFVTMLIGVNDWVQGVDAQTFRKNVEYIFGELLKNLPPKHILVVTIPDFSVTPTGQQFSYGRDISQGIDGFNQILIAEARSHGIKTVDLYPLSQSMGQDATLIAQDGLHPSSKEYARWADLIEPVVKDAL